MLKNRGYHFKHIDGPGRCLLSTVFEKHMMFAFLTDQSQKLCLSVVQAVLKEHPNKKSLYKNSGFLFR